MGADVNDLRKQSACLYHTIFVDLTIKFTNLVLVKAEAEKQFSLQDWVGENLGYWMHL